MKDYLARMFRYVAWADRRTLESLRAAPNAHVETLPLMAHVLAAEHVWLSRLEQRNPHHTVWPTLTLDECVSLVAENEAGYRAYLDQRGEDDLAGVVRYRTTQGQEFTSSILDILTQVITHGPYHRGQVAKILGRHGAAVLNTDFITFSREAEPKG